ncbi:hypothetical protein YPPY36_2119, partial [Yersinia pestis PY-36]
MPTTLHDIRPIH